MISYPGEPKWKKAENHRETFGVRENLPTDSRMWISHT
jgi:hypothetical protein